MGELTRQYDWSTSPLGTPDTWPQSLRTTLSIVLNSKFPMFLFWGEQHICFYNDAYRPSLGIDGKHPSALGKPGAQVWPDIWTVIKPLLDQVLAGEGATWSEDQLIPIYRNGHLEDAYWTFSYSPVMDEAGNILSVLVTCMETTQKVETLSDLVASREELEFAIEAAELGIWDLDPRTNTFRANARLKEWFGLEPAQEIPLLLATDVIAPEDRQRVMDLIEQTLRHTSGGLYDTEYTIIHPLTRQPRRVRAKGKVWFSDNQVAYRFNGTLQDVTEQATAQRKLEESELQSRSLVEQSPVRTILLTGEQMIITRVNEPILKSWEKDASVIGKPLLDILPQLRGQSFPQLLTDVYTTGKPYTAYEAPVTLRRKDTDDTQYYDFTYQPMRAASGEIYGVLSTAVDVTEKVKTRRQIEASEARFRSLIEEAPIANCLFTGRDMVVEIANQTMLGYWGKGDSVLGKPLKEGVPELVGQPFLAILDQVFTTGETYTARDAEAQLVVNGILGTYYFDFTYKALRDENGVIYGVMDTAVEVTQDLQARQRLEAAESSLRHAIDVAELGTWSYDLTTRQMTYSQRMLDWYGFEEAVVAVEEVVGAFEADDLSRHQRLLNGEAWWHEDDTIDDEHTIINRRTGRTYIIHSIGKRIVNEAGITLRLEGTSRDVTIERNMQYALESQVQQRTEELAAINEELAATNEELLTTNEDFVVANRALEMANDDLIRSNQNLEQFAYIASHDLQEPLRKIQQFSDLLLGQHKDSLGEGTTYLHRMQTAASRMSLLIKDLLAFSRISTSQAIAQPVAIDEVINRVLDNLSVAIDESGAQISVDRLPVVQGDEQQLDQLFQNLLSNALKFHRRTHTGEVVPPQVAVRTKLVYRNELPNSLQPTRYVEVYHLIEVSDKGIGFEEKYLDRIFQVFQRLHGRNEFAGTGVGLAIVQKVVTNHGGAITATSKPGEGATFCIYLPA